MRSRETGEVNWTPPPPEGTSSARVELENGELVFVTSIVRPMEAETREQADKLRSARILDADGNIVQKAGMLAFGHEPNPDADDGTFVGTVIDVTRSND